MPTAFPLNAWYAAAWDVDLKQTLFPRTICGKHVVMYRQSNGRVAALEDACWHRLVPLSKGRLDGDAVVCGYHGLKYNAQGRCTYMPSQETINPSACVRSYPVVERHRFIWLWMGDPALADPALVPDMHWNDNPAWAGDGKTIHVNATIVSSSTTSWTSPTRPSYTAPASATTMSPKRRSTSPMASAP
jgi:phenylpropionate dioxygenase-like ring-hydroxylating dioxygenase large terminal subunit